MLFNQIVGHKALKERLIKQIQSERFSHSMLFLGAEGYGGLAMASAFAQYLNCQNPFEDDSCGVCPSCKQHAKLEHPDIYYSYPIAQSSSHRTSDSYVTEFREAFLKQPYLNLEEWYTAMGNEKKQGVISVHESADIIKKTNLKSFSGGYKVVVLWHPELMNASASNKLLKLIEEPPAKTIFILVANHTDQILGTILSRSQLIRIPLLEAEDIANALNQNNQVGIEKAQEIANVSNGDFSKALSLIDANDNSNFDVFASWMRICFKKNVKGIIEWVDDFASDGREKHKQFIQYALHMFRQAVVFNYNPDLVKLMGKELAFNTKFAPFINHANIQEFTDAFNEAFAHVERNANPKILFLDLSFIVFKHLKKAA